jgi:acyl-CoA reductase-like NAD-dependent aldehyde dehydrogenase
MSSEPHPESGVDQMPTLKLSMYIDGQWRGASDEASFAVINPFDGEAWAEVPAASADDVDTAVTAARRAFGGPWSQSTPLLRAGLLRKLGDLILESADELADLQVKENGKHPRSRQPDKVARQPLPLRRDVGDLRGNRSCPNSVGPTLNARK